MAETRGWSYGIGCAWPLAENYPAFYPGLSCFKIPEHCLQPIMNIKIKYLSDYSVIFKVNFDIIFNVWQFLSAVYTCLDN